MTLAKGGESFALSAGYFKGEKLVGIWNKGVYIPFSAGFLTIKGYVILMEDVVENSLTERERPSVTLSRWMLTQMLKILKL